MYIDKLFMIIYIILFYLDMPSFLTNNIHIKKDIIVDESINGNSDYPSI